MRICSRISWSQSGVDVAERYAPLIFWSILKVFSLSYKCGNCMLRFILIIQECSEEQTSIRCERKPLLQITKVWLCWCKSFHMEIRNVSRSTTLMLFFKITILSDLEQMFGNIEMERLSNDVKAVPLYGQFCWSWCIFYFKMGDGQSPNHGLGVNRFFDWLNSHMQRK